MGLMDFANDIESNLYDNYSLVAKEAYVNLFFDPQVFQNSCAINAQLQLLEEYTGMEIPENVMAAYAAKHGFLKILGDSSSYGTQSDNLNRLLDKAGINSELGRLNGVEELKEALNNNKDILIPVDSKELYSEGDLPKPNHQTRIIGYDNDTFSIQDPDEGLQHVSEQELINGWDDSLYLGVVVEPPDPSDIAQIQQNIFEMQGDVSPEELLDARIEDAVARYGHDVVDYAKMGLGSASDQMDVNDLPEDVKTDMQAINVDVENIVATGGYLALMEFFKDNKQKQKKVTKVALALGAFDAFTDFSGEEIELDFEINPLLITSLAYYISQVASRSKNVRLQKFSMGFSNILTKSFRVLEYAGFAAVAIEGIDLITDIGLSEFFLEMVDTIDFLDILGDVGDAAAGGADIIEGFATLGLSIIAARVVRHLVKKLNKDDVDKVEKLTRKTTPKKTLAKLLEEDAPMPMLLGPYNEMIKEK